MSTHYDDPHGDLLARALRAEAESIVPAGDGLTKIRGRVEQRRSRFRWLIPSASVVTAAALGGIAFGAYSISHNDDSLRTQQPANSQTASGGPTASTHPTSTPSGHPASPPVVSQTGTAFTGDVTPVWPFDNAAQVASWQQGYAADGLAPWHLDPVYTATAFVTRGIGFSGQNVVAVRDTATGHRSGDVTLGTRTTASGRTVVFGTAHLIRWGNGADAPWEVTGIDSTGARIDSPSRDSSVSSPLTVRYTLDGGAEENVTVSVHDGDSYAAAKPAVVGGGQHTVTFDLGNVTTTNGYVAVSDVQSGSGTSTLQRLIVTPVRFAAVAVAASNPPATQKYPTYFVAAAKDNRLAVYYAKGGGFARWLTPPSAHWPASAPYLDSAHEWVYYLAGADELRRVHVTGGTPETVQKGELQINAFAVTGASDEMLAYVAVGANTNGSQPSMTVQWKDAKTGAAGAIAFPNPATAEQLAWAPDGRHLAVTTRSGTAWGVRVYDTATATTADQGVAIPCAAGESCSAPSYDAAGNLYFVQAPDATTWSLMQWTGTQVKHVSTWTLTTQASPETATVDITPDAEAALVGTPAGETYRIEHGRATLLPTQASQPTW
jgi:hypothetical protein